MAPSISMVKCAVMNAFYYAAEWLVLKSHSLDLLAALECQALAVRVLSHVRTQAATGRFFKDKATQLQAKIIEALPTDRCATAIARGQASTVEALVATLLAAMR